MDLVKSETGSIKKLKSFADFKNYEDDWWDQIKTEIANRKMMKTPTPGQVRYFYIPNTNIPVLDNLSEHFYKKIYDKYHIHCFISVSDEDVGTPWHTDTKNLSYLLTINLIGKTTWEFENGIVIDMNPGDAMIQNGSVRHRVLTHGRRVTVAAFSEEKAQSFKYDPEQGLFKRPF